MAGEVVAADEPARAALAVDERDVLRARAAVEEHAERAVRDRLGQRGDGLDQRGDLQLARGRPVAVADVAGELGLELAPSPVPAGRTRTPARGGSACG